MNTRDFLRHPDIDCEAWANPPLLVCVWTNVRHDVVVLGRVRDAHGIIEEVCHRFQKGADVSHGRFIRRPALV